MVDSVAGAAQDWLIWLIGVIGIIASGPGVVMIRNYFFRIRIRNPELRIQIQEAK